MPASVAQLLHRVMAIFRWMPVPHVSSRPWNGSALRMVLANVRRCSLSVTGKRSRQLVTVGKMLGWNVQHGSQRCIRKGL